MTQLPIKELLVNEFPVLLKEINDPPEKLYIQGTLPGPETKLLCVVGSRKYTNYGKEACEKLITGLRGYDIAIVSGLALGIDSIAHKSALEAGLKTVSVPGSGLDPRVLYPKNNIQLSQKILSSRGALISEFDPMFKATIWSFPQRNRIMAGMSHATLIIEAELKSGTLITSKLATEYNRDVFTVPGSIFSPTSAGPHMLLRLGATPITSSKDLLEALGFKTENNEKTSAEKYVDCSPEEMKIVELLLNPMSRDTLLSESGFDISQANAVLSMMEIKGLIVERMGEVRLT
ncbi:MAG: DNA-protecting protein DprA [Parcubacteria group bacterium]|nr:DNA-protecting protein DprA [Parcubacteria group bacterium]